MCEVVVAEDGGGGGGLLRGGGGLLRGGGGGGYFDGAGWCECEEALILLLDLRLREDGDWTEDGCWSFGEGGGGSGEAGHFVVCILYAVTVAAQVWYRK